jgi:cell division protein FtsN
MARDYKYRTRRRKKRAKLSAWLGVISGLVIGLFVAFLVYIKMQAAPQQAAVYQESILPPVEQTRPAAELPAARAPAPQPAEPPRPRFDFYTLLPEMEVVVPDDEITPAPAPVTRPVPGTTPAVQPAGSPATAAADETYLLQVGSFRNGEQADRFRAELAILGLETSIQKVTIDNKDTYHRVRVGPFHDSVALNNARNLLKKQNIESKVIKLKN